MAYDETLASRVREYLIEEPGIGEMKMFGGLSFLLRGNMACGIVKNDLIVRVGPDKYAEGLTEPHTSEFNMTGRTMRGWVVVAPEGVATDDTLAAWVQRGVAYAETFPAKAPKPRKKPSKK